METTTNIGLAKYEETDKFNITGENNSLNKNMDIIDEKMGAVPSGSNLQAEIESVNTAISGLSTGKVNKPSGNGTNGQLLRTNGDGTTEWTSQGAPTDAQVEAQVASWLEDHPDVTTTVQDGAISYAKLDSNLKGKTDEIDELKSAINAAEISLNTGYIEINPHKTNWNLGYFTSAGVFQSSVRNATPTNTPFLLTAKTKVHIIPGSYSVYVTTYTKNGNTYTAGAETTYTQDTYFSYANDKYVTIVFNNGEIIDLTTFDGKIELETLSGKNYESKLNTIQGTDNAGKWLIVKNNGNISPEELTYKGYIFCLTKQIGINNNTVMYSDGMVGVSINAQKNCEYSFIINGSRNRTRIFGCNSLTQGTSATAIYNDSATGETSTEFSYSYYNTEYDYIVVFVAYLMDSQSANVYINCVGDTGKINKRIDDEHDLFVNELYTDYSIDNYYDIDTEQSNKSVSSSSGAVVTLEGYNCSSYIEIVGGLNYYAAPFHSAAFYDENKVFISGSGSSSSGDIDIEKYGKQVSAPNNAKYIIFAYSDTYAETITSPYVKSLYVPDEMPKKHIRGGLIHENYNYKIRFSTMKLDGEDPSGAHHNLCLIANKLIYGTDTKPEYRGFILIDRETEYIYWVDSNLCNVKKIAEWDRTLSSNRAIDRYVCTVTNDGDLVFVLYWERSNPIVYKHTDYANPIMVDFTGDLQPMGWLTSTSVVQFDDGSFLYGEYKPHSAQDEQNEDPRCIWKVSGDPSQKSNWTIKKRFKHKYTQPQTGAVVPEEEIGHVHTMVWDFYANTLICSTGDYNEHCKVFISKDKGETWTLVASGSQLYRALGCTFREEDAWYGNDAPYEPRLCRIPRGQDGELDWQNLEVACNMAIPNPTTDPAFTQATYATLLNNEPYGLLLIERSEPRSDDKLDIRFYSFEDNKLHIVGTVGKSIYSGDGYIGDGRNGLPIQDCTEYVPTALNLLLCGGGIYARQGSADILNNSVDNYIGLLKMEIIRDFENFE